MIKIARLEDYWPWHVKMCLAAVTVQAVAMVAYTIYYASFSGDPDWKLGLAFIPVAIGLSGLVAFVYPLSLVALAAAMVFPADKLIDILGVLTAPALLFSILFLVIRATWKRLSIARNFAVSMGVASVALTAAYVLLSGVTV